MSLQDKQKEILKLFKYVGYEDPSDLAPEFLDLRIQNIQKLPRGFHFSGFNKEHMDEAEKLYRLFYEAKDFDEFIALAKQAKNVHNEGLFVFSAHVALLHREDTRGLITPPIYEIFPHLFIPNETIHKAIRADLFRKDNKTIFIDIDHTANVTDPEYHVAYFREDIGANSHHWNWHAVYPSSWNPEKMGKEKDRKGELFYYMHQQMCARYDIERLCFGLQRVIPYHNFDEAIYGHFPHMCLASGKEFSMRPSGLRLHDVKGVVTVKKLRRWTERILEAIDLGKVVDKNGQEVALTPETGINVLGAIVESSYESVNKKFYGNLHNMMHDMIASIADPDGRYLEFMGVMGDVSTAVRDPIFFRLHRFINDIYQEYKATLPPYEKKDLDFPGITMKNVTLKTRIPNIINTFMKEKLLALNHAIPLKGEVKVRYNQLDHEPFTYHITCENSTGSKRKATVRIYLGPIYDEVNNEFSLTESRNYFIELDRFVAELVPGNNTIERMSIDSSVTIKGLPTVEEIDKSGDIPGLPDEICNCGWPDNLLVPKGNYKGMDFYLFVMLTDYEQDKVEGHSQNRECVEAMSYCGVKDAKYPDKKPMGFPFDRLITADTIGEFKTPNMHFQNVKVQFKD